MWERMKVFISMFGYQDPGGLPLSKTRGSYHSPVWWGEKQNACQSRDIWGEAVSPEQEVPTLNTNFLPSAIVTSEMRIK